MTTCDSCGGALRIGDFPFCGGDPAKHEPSRLNTIGDDIPGGVLMHHGICHADGTPKRYYSKSDIAKAATAKGYTNWVEHIPKRGSDKSPHTSRWV